MARRTVIASDNALNAGARMIGSLTAPQPIPTQLVANYGAFSTRNAVQTNIIS
jgi:uncharacterized protein YqjF (DUF2071 family)